MHWRQFIGEKLQAANYKITRQREQIIEVLAAHPDEHLSAEDVYGLLLQSSSDVGLTTVYRTLDTLEKIGILHKIDFGDGHTRYEFKHSHEKHHHHHLICVSCGAVSEFKDALLEELEESIKKLHNFEILDHQVKFFGYCRECQKNDEK